MTTSMRSRPTSTKHSIERPAGVVSVHTVFGRTLCVADGSAKGVTSFARPGSFGTAALGMLILLTEMAGPRVAGILSPEHGCDEDVRCGPHARVIVGDPPKPGVFARRYLIGKAA